MRLPLTTKLRRVFPALSLALLLVAPPVAIAGVASADRSHTANAAHPSAPMDALLEAAAAGDMRPLEAALPGIDDPALQALARARLAASRLDPVAVDAQLARYWHSDARTSTLDAAAWSIAADAAFAAGRYARAAEATRAWSELLATAGDPRGEAAGVAQFHGIADILSDLPAQDVVEREPRPAAISPDKAGLLRAHVRVNGLDQDAVLDTGANLSVVSRSAAERLGLRILDAEGSVGSASRDEVATRIGVARRLEIAGVTLSNVAFLVLADSALEMPLPGGYRIDAIIGFPVLRAIGRMRVDGDSLLPLNPAASTDSTPGNLRASGNDLFVDATVGGIPVALHLDTGAPASFLSTRFAQAHPQALDGLRRSQRRSASAGGAITQQSAVWENVDVAIDGHAVTLPALHVMVSDAAPVETRTAGTLGLDVLGRHAYVLDFVSMRLDVEAPE